MVKFIQLIVHILYLYYNKGSNKSISKFNAISSFSFLIFLGITTLFVFFKLDVVGYYPIINNYGSLAKFISGAVLLLLIFLTINYFLDMKEVVDMKISKNKYILGINIIFIFVFLNLAILGFLLL